ncbi:MAG: MBL fold metallo-hydrolase [Candidatus Kapaibacteriales bacterium]
MEATMTTDKFSIRTIETGTFGLDGGAMFGIVPKPLWTKAYAEPDELNRIPLSTRLLLLEWGDKKILIDTGNGNKFSEKQLEIYKIVPEVSNLENALQRNGIKPESITDVILTHLHFDHCGGSTKKNGNDILPTLQNARYYVQKEQFLWASQPTEKDRASFMPEDFQPLFVHGVLELVEGQFQLFPNVELIPLFGHTQSMQAVKVNLNGQVYFYPADLIPTSAHISLPYLLAFDNFPLTNLKEKKQYLSQAVEENWIIIFEHDAFVKAGRVTKQNGQFILSEKINL